MNTNAASTIISPIRVILYLLYTLIPLTVFYFLFRDFRVYDFWLRITAEKTGLAGIPYYAIGFLLSFVTVNLLYYNLSTPMVEDCLSLGIMDRFIVERLEDSRSHKLVHVVLFVLLWLARVSSMWLGTDFGVSFYFVVWGGAVVSFVLRVVSLRPLGTDDARYMKSKTRFIRTGRSSPHSKAMMMPMLLIMFGEFVLFMIHVSA